MKLKSKLVIGFSTLLAVMLVLTLIGYDRISFMNRQMDTIFQDRYQKVQNANGMRGEVNNMARKLTNMISSNDATTYDVSRQEIEMMTKKAEDYFKTIKESISIAEEQQLLMRIERAVNEYLVYQNKTLELLASNDYRGADSLRNSTGQAVQEEMLTSLNELSSYEDHKINEDIKTAKAAYDRSVQVFIYLMVGGLLIGMLVILWILPVFHGGLMLSL